MRRSLRRAALLCALPLLLTACSAGAGTASKSSDTGSEAPSVSSAAAPVAAGSAAESRPPGAEDRYQTSAVLDIVPGADYDKIYSENSPLFWYAMLKLNGNLYFLRGSADEKDAQLVERTGAGVERIVLQLDKEYGMVLCFAPIDETQLLLSTAMPENNIVVNIKDRAREPYIYKSKNSDHPFFYRGREYFTQELSSGYTLWVSHNGTTTPVAESIADHFFFNDQFYCVANDANNKILVMSLTGKWVQTISLENELFKPNIFQITDDHIVFTDVDFAILDRQGGFTPAATTICIADISGKTAYTYRAMGGDAVIPLKNYFLRRIGTRIEKVDYSGNILKTKTYDASNTPWESWEKLTFTKFEERQGNLYLNFLNAALFKLEDDLSLKRVYSVEGYDPILVNTIDGTLFVTSPWSGIDLAIKL